MKILVFSLLRLGDFVMHQEILRDLEQTYPNCQIGLAVNESVGASGLIHSDDRTIHKFPRKMLQDEIVLKEGSFFRAFVKLKDWIQEIRNQSYDYVVDLTHTELSRALLAALEIPELNSERRRFLNNIFSVSKQSSFHYVDALRTSIGLFEHAKENPRKAGKIRKVVIQPLTSDTKKNWPLQNYSVLIEELAQMDPKLRFTIVGSQTEEMTISDHFKERTNLSIEICSLPRLCEILEANDLLISGDTATIHLAAQTQMAIFGIYLGSAEPTKTAPRTENAWIVQSDESCVPCRHSSQCFQTSHLCAQSVQPHDIVSILRPLISGDDKEFAAKAWGVPFSVLQPRVNELGFYTIEPISQPEWAFLQVLRQSVFLKLYFDRSSKTEDLIANYRGEMWELSIWIDEAEIAGQRVAGVIRELQNGLRGISKSCLRLDLDVESQLNLMADNVREFAMISDDPEWSSCLEAALKDSRSQTSFAVYKRWRGLIDELNRFYTIQLETLDSIRSMLRERGVVYVPGPTRAT